MSDQRIRGSTLAAFAGLCVAQIWLMLVFGPAIANMWMMLGGVAVVLPSLLLPKP